MNVRQIRHVIAWPAALVGLVLIGSGLVIDHATQWRLHLLAGLWLLSLPPRALLAEHEAVVTRGVARVALVIGLGFCAVALQLTRNQIIQADEIRTRAAIILEPTPILAPTPTVVATVAPTDRTRLGTNHVVPVKIDYAQRGNIYDRYGNVLATTRDGRRIYTNPDLAHIVGFQSQIYGLTGVEGSFDDYLSGERSLVASDLLRSRMLSTTVGTSTADVYLTLDTRLQAVAQGALGARQGAVVLLDPRTGAILALASYPRFDPNLLVLTEPVSEQDIANVRALWENLATRPDAPLINRATQGRYPPGSIIKTLTAAAALDSGVLPVPESQITCPNRFYSGEVGAPPVRNYLDGLASFTGNPSDLRRVYAFSCNTAFAQMGLLIGFDGFSDYAARFGLGYAEEGPAQPDVREIAADAGTIASSPAFLQRPAALADSAFGQGQILATPLDMAQMVALIANEGRLMRPYVVQEARMHNEPIYTGQPTALRQVISPQSAAHMRSIMYTSVEIGYAKPVQIPNVTIGAKTGTAEVPGGAPHSWFVAIAPVEQPRFAISVIIENGGEGSVAALPVARQVLVEALR